MKIRSRHNETKSEANWFDAKAYFSGRFDGDKKGRFLILWGGDVRRKIIGIGSSDLHTAKDSMEVVAVDGIPTTVMRCTARFEKAVLGSTNINCTYSYITHRFADSDVRWLFPELWVAWKNAAAKKVRRRDIHNYLTAKKQGKLKLNTNDEKTIRGITQEYSMRTAAKHYGVI